MVWPLTLPAVVLAWLRKFVSALLAWFATVIDSDTASRWCPQLRTVVLATKVVTHVPKFRCLAGHFAATLHISALCGLRIIVASRLRANGTASHCATHCGQIFTGTAADLVPKHTANDGTQDGTRDV